MKQTTLLLISLILLSACSKKESVSQLAIMIGSESSDFESIETFKRISEGVSAGISGDEWGGEVMALADGKEFLSESWGGHVHLLSPNSNRIELKGETEKDIYLIALYQHFYRWPDDYDGVVLHKTKLNAGGIDYAVDLSEPIERAKHLLQD